MSSVTLTAAVRSNLLSLQDVTANQATTQQRLATGKKVNSALDNPTNYFTAAALSARAGQLTNLLDSMTNGINTLKAADNGLTSITTTLQSMQATVTQTRQDASWQSASYSVDATAIGTTAVKNLGFSGGSVGSSTVNVSLTTQNQTTGLTLPYAGVDGLKIKVSDGAIVSGDITMNTGDTADSLVTKINAATKLSGTAVTASNVGGQVKITSDSGTLAVTDGTGTAGGATALSLAAAAYAVKTTDQIVSTINATASLSGKVKASNNAGSLQITNLSADTTNALTIKGAGGANNTIDGATTTSASVAGNSTRANLVTQFNQLKDQLDKTASDSSFNGINLLNGDALKLYFNENSTSSITIQSTNTSGINASTLGVTAASTTEFQSNTSLDSRLQQLQTAVTTVASQASAFGNNLSIVQNRQTFTNNMVNTLQTGSDGLTLADGNLEGANMLALQTRQQLSIQALSLASQANSAVMRLFG